MHRLLLCFIQVALSLQLTDKKAISELPFATFQSEGVLVRNFSFENEFVLHKNEPVGDHIFI